MTDPVTTALFEPHTREQLRAIVAAMTPDELHRYACSYNWDDGPEPMHWVAERPDCDLGTAVTVFWLTSPFTFGSRSAPTPTPASRDPAIATLAAFIRDRVNSGAYTRQQISVDPVPAFIPNRLQLELLRRRGLPQVFLAPTPGRSIRSGP